MLEIDKKPAVPKAWDIYVVAVFDSAVEHVLFGEYLARNSEFGYDPVGNLTYIFSDEVVFGKP